MAYAPNGPHRARVQWAGVAVIAVVLAGGGLLAAHHRYHECPTLITSHGIPVGCESTVAPPPGV
jgi:hypothetical protein